MPVTMGGANVGCGGISPVGQQGHVICCKMDGRLAAAAAAAATV